MVTKFKTRKQAQKQKKREKAKRTFFRPSPTPIHDDVSTHTVPFFLFFSIPRVVLHRCFNVLRFTRFHPSPWPHTTCLYKCLCADFVCDRLDRSTLIVFFRRSGNSEFHCFSVEAKNLSKIAFFLSQRFSSFHLSLSPF